MNTVHESESVMSPTNRSKGDLLHQLALRSNENSRSRPGRDSESGSTIKQISRDEVRAELKDGRVIKLDTPKYLYEADLLNGNKVAEIMVTPEGQATEGPRWIVRPL
jgi:hypothetical protein